MDAIVRLTVETGPHKGRKSCFSHGARCRIGRAPDCFVQLAGSERDLAISRHHCQLFVKDDSFTLQDSGSSNGTYLNGLKIDTVEMPFLVDGEINSPHLVQGNFLTIGGTTLRIDIVQCPFCSPEPAQVWKHGETAIADCPLSCP